MTLKAIPLIALLATVFKTLSIGIKASALTQLSTPTIPIPIDNSGVSTLAWSPDGKLLAVGHDTLSGRFEIIDPVAHSQLYSSQDPGQVVAGVAWSPSSNMIAVSQGAVAILNTVSYTWQDFIPSGNPDPAAKPTPDPSKIAYDYSGAIAWSPDNSKLVFGVGRGEGSGSPQWLLLGNPLTNQSVANFEVGGEAAAPIDLSWNPDSTQLVDRQESKNR